MANITLSGYGTIGSADDVVNKAIHVRPTTNTPFVTPTFSSVARVTAPPSPAVNFNIEDLFSSSGGERTNAKAALTGRRPSSGLLFPRGYYNM